MKQKRSISRIWVSYFNPEIDKLESRCFEDLPEEVQKELLLSKNKEWVSNLCIMLADVINDMSEQLDIKTFNG